METFVSSEGDFKAYDQPFPEGLLMVHFKMVGIGANTQKKAEWNGGKLCDIVRNIPGFFVVSDNTKDLRAAMHDLVDRFCDSQEGKS